jgi:hypothetical protein
MRGKLALIGCSIMILSVVMVASPAAACHNQTVSCLTASWTDDDMSPDNVEITPPQQTVEPGKTKEYEIKMTLSPGCGNSYFLYTSLGSVPSGWKATYTSDKNGQGTDYRYIDNQACGSGNVVIYGYLDVTAPNSAAEGETAVITATMGADDNARNDKDIVAVKTTTKVHIPDPPPVINNPVAPFTIVEDTEDSTHVNMTSLFRDTDNDPMVYGKQDNPNFDISMFATGRTVIKPKPNYNGNETLIFTASDLITMIQAEVKVEVTPVPDPVILAMPIKDFFIAKDGEDSTTVNLNKVFTDADTPYGDVLSFCATGWTNISVSIKVDGKVVFKPLAGWAGNETIKFTATDTTANSVYDEVKVTVTDTRRPPYVKNQLKDRTFPEDTVDTSIDLSGIFASPDVGTVLTYGTMGCCFINITIAPDGKVTMVPAKDAIGSETITWWASDGMFAPVFAAAKVTVSSVNDPPYIKKPLNITMDEDTPSAPVFLDYYFGDADGTKLTYSMKSTETLTVTIISSTGQLTITPALNYNGEQSLTLVATDGEEDAVMTVPVTVNPVDDAPMLTEWLPGGNIMCTEGDKISFSVQALDIDGDTLGSVWMVDDNHTIMLKYDDKLAIDVKATSDIGLGPGTHTIAVWVDGNERSSVSHSWQVTVKQGNRAPVISEVKTVPSVNITTKTPVTFEVNAVDPDQDAMTYKWFVDGTETSQLRSFSITLTAIGTHRAKVTVTDSKGASNTSEEFTFTVAKPVIKPAAKTQPGFEGLALLAALGAIAVILRRRK